jgi:hypothetical protein
MRISSHTKTNQRGHFDFLFKNDEFFNSPGLQNPHITPSDFIVASATELDSTSTPISGGAHVTVQQVVPGNDQVIVRVWVDNVPVGINVRCNVIIPLE